MLESTLFAACASDTSYSIPGSIRCRGSANPNVYKVYTNALPADTSAYHKTYSMWVKRGVLGSSGTLLSNGLSTATYWWIGFTASDQIQVYAGYSTTALTNKITIALYRDTAAWYHIVVAYDLTLADPEDRVKLYVNGTRVTSFGTNTVPAQNDIYSAAYLVPVAGTYYANIGDWEWNTSNNFDGYITAIYGIDGQTLSPTSFGQFSTTTSQWIPIAYTGTYGTSGFYLNFTNASSTTTLGYDASGNNNNWLTTGISLTAGYTYDAVLDSPTINYPVINPGTKGTTYSAPINGNLSITVTAATNIGIMTSTLMTSGFYYAEVTVTTNNQANAYFGVCQPTASTQYAVGATTGGWAIAPGPNLYWTAINGTQTNIGSTGFTNTGTYGIAIDATNGKLWFTDQTGTWISGNPALGTSPLMSGIPTSQGLVFAVGHIAGSAYTTYQSINFGQQPFAYTLPIGFAKLCTTTLPTPSISRGDTGLKIVTYTGNGGEIQIGQSQFPKFNYTIGKSLRFRSSASPQLSRLTTSSSNAQTWTFSGWFKRSLVASGPYTLFSSSNNAASTYQTQIYIYSDDTLRLFNNPGSGTSWFLQPSQLFRDTSNWFHITVAYDSTQATSSNRVKVWINGVQITSFSSASYPALNENSYVNQSAYTAHIGNTSTSSIYEGYIAECYLIDGQALTPTSFGTFDINGYWIPASYAGTYGTNGFYLNFSDNSTLTTSSNVGIGKDWSGNGNYFTSTNISLTAGRTYDSMLDTPTNNYCTINQLAVDTGYVTLSEGGLYFTTSNSSSQPTARGSVYLNSGNWYWEVTYLGGSGDCILGITGQPTPIRGYSYPNCIFYDSTGAVGGDNSITYASVATYTTNDVVGIAVDFNNRNISFYKNNTLIGTYQIPGTITSFTPFWQGDGTSNNSTMFWDFGQKGFKYTPPTGYNAICNSNMVENTLGLTNPDLVWIKSRSAATSNMLFDSVRGPTNYINSDLGALETSDVNSLITFDTDGFYIGNNTNINTNNATYIAWMWKAGSTAVTNTNGTISSHVNASPSNGFSIVTYNGSGTSTDTVGHGLGVVPAMVIIHVRTGTAMDPIVKHSSIPTSGNVFLDLLQGYQTSYTYGGIADLTSSTTFGFIAGSSNLLQVNSSASTYVAYCWAQIAGYSSFGSYVGNASTDGPFIYCGFKPRWVMLKNISNAETSLAWAIHDTTRDTYNVQSDIISAASTAAESTGTELIDMLSNGFKLRNSTSHNISGNTYIYAAFAETPFNYATAR